MLEVHAILQRQRCNENITKKTGTLSDAYDKEVYIAYFREPDFVAFSKFAQLQKKDEIAAVRSLARDTFIQGDKELVDDDSLFLYGLSAKLVNIIGSRQAKVANFSIAGK